MISYLSLVSDPLQFGRGHLTRQQQVQLEFEKLGIEHSIYINTSESASLILKREATLLLDLSVLDAEPSKDFLKQFTEVVGFDWSGEFVPDRNFVVLSHPDKTYQASQDVSIGLQNLIIRQEISILRESLAATKQEHLLISLGYSSGEKAYLNALSLAKDLPEMPVIIASGRELDIFSSGDLRMVIDSPDFIQFLSSAKAVISNGGTTYIESLLLGKSVLPIPQTDDEKYFVDTINSITCPDLTLPGFWRLDGEKASKAGVGFRGAERLCRIIKEGL
jgi:spore coat polysaccharide biosynthesis predicted glycosyltransferase SpsG